jgi:prevent-host-death family protein
MTISATELRANLYRILDRVLDKGETVEIARRGKTVKIVPGTPPNKMSRLTKRGDYLKCDPDDIVHMDWSNEWKP